MPYCYGRQHRKDEVNLRHGKNERDVTYSFRPSLAMRKIGATIYFIADADSFLTVGGSE